MKINSDEETSEILGKRTANTSTVTDQFLYEKPFKMQKSDEFFNDSNPTCAVLPTTKS